MTSTFQQWLRPASADYRAGSREGIAWHTATELPDRPATLRPEETVCAICRRGVTPSTRAERLLRAGVSPYWALHCSDCVAQLAARGAASLLAGHSARAGTRRDQEAAP